MLTIEALKQMPQWVGHQNKIPKNPHNGQNAQSNNPATWSTASQAWAAKCRYGWDGIGFVFTIESGVVGVDIDKCFIGGVMNPEAQQVIGCLNSYTEFSPSGTGIHILVQGKIPNSLKSERIEIYNELRYFTVTGNQYQSTGYIAERQNELDAIYVTFGGSFDDGDKLPDVTPRNFDNDVTEAQIRQWLDVIPAHGDYNTFWLPVLMAVHDAFPDERGVALIEAWSPGYKGEVRRKFRSFDRTSKNGIGIGTLVHLAKQHGWKPPQKQQQKRTNNFDLRNAL